MKRILLIFLILSFKHPSQWKYEIRKLKEDSNRKIR